VKGGYYKLIVAALWKQGGDPWWKPKPVKLKVLS
jgi:hypothetical protein